ncbi:lysylphosphatidylglycerol synthase transmembrane domain-containing protein [Candidatus Latescibacterota bacterium]
MSVRFVVVAVLFSILLRTVQPSEIIEAFRQADPLYFGLAVFLMIPNLLLQMIKWNYLLGKLTNKPSFSRVAVSVLGGYFLGAISPARSGEMARGILIPGQSTLKIASLTIADKGMNQIMVIVAGLFTLVVILPMPLSLLPLIGVVTLIGALFNIHRLRPVIERFLHKYIHTKKVDNILAAFDALSTETVIVMTGLTFLLYLVFVFQFYVVIVSFVDLPVSTAVRTLPVIYLINYVLPVSFGDFGVKEMATVHLLQPFGIAGGESFSASITHNVLTFLAPSIIGGIICAIFFPRPDREVPSSACDKVHEQEM